MNKTIVMTGGGTAGHVIPNLALIPRIEQKGYRIEYIGTKNGMEKSIINKIPYHVISAGKLRRYFSLKNFVDPFKIAVGYFQAKKILKKIKPCTVFSKGGFVSVPVVFAAHSLKIRVVLHESDYTPGLANRLCIPKADKVCVSFESALGHIPNDKGVFTGLPIRDELLKGNKDKGLKLCGFSGAKPVLLVMGGSMGAQAVNEAVDNIIPELLNKFDIVHIRGKENLLQKDMPNGYKQFGFVSEELADIYTATDIMVSRAGATAVFEILALQIPALLIPLPRSCSRGDQILNAEHFEKKGYSIVADQEKITPDSLKDAIYNLYKNKDKISAVLKRQDASYAAEKVVKVILDEQ